MWKDGFSRARTQWKAFFCASSFSAFPTKNDYDIPFLSFGGANIVWQSALLEKNEKLSYILFIYICQNRAWPFEHVAGASSII